MNRLFAKISLSVVSCSLLLSSLSSLCYAEPDSGKVLNDSDYRSGPHLDSLQMIGQVILYLLVIIGLFLLIIKLIAKKNRNSSYGRSIRSLGGVPLGQNKSIQIVEIGHSLFVVGVGQDIQLLDKIDQPDEVAYISELLEANHQANSNLISLGKWFSKLQNKHKEDEEVEITESFQQVFQDKLRDVSNRKKRVEELLLDEKQTDRLNDQ